MTAIIGITLGLAVVIGLLVLFVKSGSNSDRQGFADNRPDGHPRLRITPPDRHKSGTPPPRSHGNSDHDPDFFERPQSYAANRDKQFPGGGEREAEQDHFEPPRDWTGNSSQMNEDEGDFLPAGDWKPDGYDEDDEEILWAIEAESPHDPMTEPTITTNIFGGEDHDYGDGTVVVFNGYGQLFQYIIDGLDVNDELSRRHFRDL